MNHAMFFQCPLKMRMPALQFGVFDQAGQRMMGVLAWVRTEMSDQRANQIRHLHLKGDESAAVLGCTAPAAQDLDQLAQR